MKSLLLLPFVVLITSQAFGEDVCKKLADVVKFHEEQLQLSSVQEINEQGEKKDCRPENAESQIQGQHQTFNESHMVLVKEYACATLSTIETRIAQLENEQNLLTGLHKLKSDIAKNQDETHSTDPKKALFAGLNFVNGVNAAQSMELLLANNGTMLKAIKGMNADDRIKAEKVTTFVKDACVKDSNTSGICAKDIFRPNQKAMEAINDLINNSDLKDDQLQTWTNALAIKHEDGKPWSFAGMAKQLKGQMVNIGDGKLNLNKNQLKAIRSFEKFQSAGSAEFANMKSDIKVYSRMQEFKFHIEDLKQRQSYEIQSKAVLALSLVKDDKGLGVLSSDDKTKCEAAKNDVQSALHCTRALNALGDKVNPDLRNRIAELARATEISEAYLNSIDDKHNKCLGFQITEEFKKNPVLPQECLDSFSGVDSRQNDITLALQVLNALKDKIGEQNQDSMKVRNLALSNLNTHNDCSHLMRSSSLQCSYENLNIPQNVNVLVSHISDVMAIQREAPSLESKWLCNDKSKRAFGKELLCDLTKPKANPVVGDKRNEDTYQAPLSPPKSGKSDMASTNLQGLGMVASSLVGALFPPQQQNYFGPMNNPYPYNYSPYGYGSPMLSLSDELLFNARYYGAYGYYMPTPGLRPYSSFGTGTSSYKSYSSTTSAYFR